ncbi:replication initiator protein A [Streptococcus infantis]|uniref:replication initiator protein A n=1 Tax=Streptococcus infantis TaxID=68892 RepID=UPI001CBCC647|nr:replication initiator protein A [Streptococcus infantis]MBZ2109923.1 replication initiator protein A [Streptococcus infantis]MBZ2111771.1 replication initiator protein A [Streptococcus infantis]
MKISEVKNNAFYQMPQWLYDPPYNALSDKAKQIYMFLFDRRTLSIQNKWFDEKGDVFVYFTNEQLMEKLNCSNKPIVQAKKELHDIGLLREVRQGVNKPNRLYISGSVESTRQEVSKVHKGSVESTRQEVSKVHSIKTDNIKTNISRLSEPDGAGDNSLYSIEDAPENDLGIVHDWIFSEFGRYPTPFEIEDLKAFLQDHNKEVIKLAIKECVGNGKPYFKYLSSILRDWKQKGLVTVELVENRKNPTRRTNTGSDRVVFQEYDDPLPF